jgi:hypothetical protein
MTDDERDEERRRQRLIERRRQHRIEVAFWRQSQHPYDDSTGRRLVAEFVSALNEITGILEFVERPRRPACGRSKGAQRAMARASHHHASLLNHRKVFH